MKLKTTFSRKFMHQNSDCYTNEQLLSCSFMQRKKITLNSILESEIPLRDKYYFICTKILSNRQLEQLTIGVASIILEIYEKKIVNDPRPKEAIQATQDYIDNKINLKLLISTRHEARAAQYSAKKSGEIAAALAAAASISEGYETLAAADAAAINNPTLRESILLYVMLFIQQLK